MTPLEYGYFQLQKGILGFRARGKKKISEQKVLLKKFRNNFKILTAKIGVLEDEIQIRKVQDELFELKMSIIGVPKIEYKKM